MIVSGWLLIPLGYQLPQLEEMNFVLVIIAGLLVGFSTKTANSCTSGHGIVGMARFYLNVLLLRPVYLWVWQS